MGDSFKRIAEEGPKRKKVPQATGHKTSGRWSITLVATRRGPLEGPDDHSTVEVVGSGNSVEDAMQSALGSLENLIGQVIS